MNKRAKKCARVGCSNRRDQGRFVGELCVPCDVRRIGEERAYAVLLAERRRQDRLHGGPPHDDQHRPSEWLDFLQHQLDALRVLTPTYDRAFDTSWQEERLAKIGALALAALEVLYRKRPPNVARVTRRLGEAYGAPRGSRKS